MGEYREEVQEGYTTLRIPESVVLRVHRRLRSRVT